MPIDFYYTPGSPGCRTVLLAASALNIDLNMKLVDWATQENLKPEFLKLNPQHTVPTIVDHGFSLWESRAIIRYLADKYGGENSLYPKEPHTRALVDQRLDFDIGTLYPRFAQYFFPHLFGGPPANEADLQKLNEALQFFNTLLEGRKYAATDDLTLADLSLAASVATIDAAGISFNEYPNVKMWFELVKATAPGYAEENQKSLDAFKAFIAMTKAKIEQ